MVIFFKVTEKDIAYYTDTQMNEYRSSQCRLDLYYPRESKKFATIVWFHGGGIKGGKMEIPMELMQK